MRFDDAFGLWREGQRRLSAAEPSDRPALERVTDALVDELRRRLGGPFTADELAAFYGREGTDWAFDIAVRVAPGQPGGVGHEHSGGGRVRAVRARGRRLRWRPPNPGSVSTRA